MDKTIKTNNLGYPRIGERRELKKATESYWKGKISLDELEKEGRRLRETNWKKQRDAGIDLIPCNDFSFYDQVLDFSCLVGNVPPRFGWDGELADLDTAFLVARGEQTSESEDGSCCGVSTFAAEMTKWFDTNYHYIVPELRRDTKFRLAGDKLFREIREAKALGVTPKPVIPGPVTYLTLAKVQDEDHPDFDRFELLDDLVTVYEEILARVDELGVDWIQIDEPVFALDLDETRRNGIIDSWKRLAAAAGNARLIATSYFAEMRDNLSLFLSLPASAFHVDAVRGGGELDEVLSRFPESAALSLGVVDGRNVWKNDYELSLRMLEKARDALGHDRVWVAPSCSLLHSPVTLANETKLDDELLGWLAFADQKLGEIVDLSEILRGTARDGALDANRAAMESRRNSPRTRNEAVRERVAGVTQADCERSSPYPERRRAQMEKLNLPEFPTTTIGSFPQTKEVRRLRAQWRRGEVSEAEYESRIEEEIRRCVEFQDEIGIDMLVHGEFERNDMVEYFGEQLDGFAFTSLGWVQSYGSRYVKPPIIFGDVTRPEPMTVRWSRFAQSLTDKPMKGMLTGPVTILQWSFVRDDLPRSTVADQIALAIRDEVVDLEAAGIAAIQIDEAALREGLPLRRDDWAQYLGWAVRAFRIASCGVEDETQIHTHMCYAEFNDIIEAIAGLDADVITIETSRSNMELLDAFVDFRYPNEIGPGVYDIHSPRVPGASEMENLMRKAESVIPRENLWVNPDCGLKTRQWEEVESSLRNMVATARELR